MKCCCKISIMQFYKLFKKIIWRHIYISKDDFINKALPFAKISPLACWWIWIFLSFLRKSHVADFIPIGTLCIDLFLTFLLVSPLHSVPIGMKSLTWNFLRKLRKIQIKQQIQGLIFTNGSDLFMKSSCK